MDFAVAEHHMSQRQALKTFSISSSVYHYVHIRKDDDAQVISMLMDLAAKRPTWGFWMMFHRLRNTGLKINHKRVYRLYKQAGLSRKRKSRKRLAKRVKAPLLQPLLPNLHWSMDFMRDSLLQNQPFRVFNVIDDFNREGLKISISKSITSQRVIMELEQLIQWRGKPERIRVDNGPEFIAQSLKDWCEDEERKIELIFIQPGKPSQNGYIERFNRTFREDVLDQWLFDELKVAQSYSNQWMWMYNNERPHSSLGNKSPREFLLKYGKLHISPADQQEFPTFQQDHNDDYELNSIFLNAAK